MQPLRAARRRRAAARPRVLLLAAERAPAPSASLTALSSVLRHSSLNQKVPPRGVDPGCRVESPVS